MFKKIVMVAAVSLIGWVFSLALFFNGASVLNGAGNFIAVIFMLGFQGQLPWSSII
ncbi:hypothetical protein [Chitiniphilus eburneus]|uniref:hypothetical protein n=1 Tax=Chitiniphilus eburneus TaxID=2571148 RepID=UPI00145FBD5A|nr:hypothetical protein [Chitiniphilus eburneus]